MIIIYLYNKSIKSKLVRACLISADIDRHFLCVYYIIPNWLNNFPPFWSNHLTSLVNPTTKILCPFKIHPSPPTSQATKKKHQALSTVIKNVWNCSSSFCSENVHEVFASINCQNNSCQLNAFPIFFPGHQIFQFLQNHARGLTLMPKPGVTPPIWRTCFMLILAEWTALPGPFW